MAGVLIVLAFIYIASQEQLTQSGNQVRVSQARLSVAILASTAQEAYSEGPGSVRTVSVTIPEGNVGARTGIFNQSVINIGLYIGNGTSDINEMVQFVVVQGANFPTQPGTYNVNVRSFEGYVMLGDPGYAISPGVIALQMLANGSASRTLTVTSYANTTLGITLALAWSNPNIAADLNGSSLLTFSLAPNQTALVNVDFASINAAFGNYGGSIGASGDNGQNLTVPIIVQIVGSQPPPPSSVSYILIDTYSDAGYTDTSSTFDPTETVDIHGSNFTANSLVAVTITNSTGSTIFTGSNSSDGSGNVTYYWNPGIVPPGAYNATLNDSTRWNSAAFSITGCS